MEVADPQGVVLEVTENPVVDDYEHLKEILAPLIERGMTLAVDDFGAGAANMRHVDALAPGCLKLDRTLVADISTDPRKSAMVEAPIRYTWRTESQLVAEDVETTADLEHLRRCARTSRPAASSRRSSASPTRCRPRMSTPCSPATRS
jgi:EAL domain-containing protein (putative c-di-GMP-specific phosphodiesterase class I)